MQPSLPPDMPPDIGQVDDHVTQLRQAVTVVIDECDQLRGTLAEAVRASLQGCVAECSQTASLCRACVSGKVQAAIDQAGAVGAKCRDRVLSRVESAILSGYSIGDHYVTVPRDIETIVAQLTRGAIQLGQAAAPVPPGLPAPPPPQNPPIMVPDPGGGPPIWVVPEGPILPPVGIVLPNDPGEHPAPVGGPPGMGGGGGPVMPPDMGGGQGACPPPIINVPACPAPNININPQLQLPPNFFSPPQDVGTLPDNTTTVTGPTPPPIVNVPVNVVVNIPGQPQEPQEPPPPTGIVGALQAIIPDWNQCDKCPAVLQGGNTEDYEAYREYLYKILGFKTPDGKAWAAPPWLHAIAQGLPSFVEWSLVSLTRNIFIDLPIYAMELFPKSATCDTLPIVPYGTIRALAGLVETWTGVGLAGLMKSMDYMIDYYCPTLIPSVEEADQMYIRDRITEDTWRCYVRANNFLDVPHKCYVDAVRPGAAVDEIVAFYRRDWVDGNQAVDEIMRTTGVIREVASNQILVREYVPGPGDIVQFMLRDVADPDVVESQKLDTDFDKKFVGKLKDWAKWQGISEETMKYHWRAHWHQPSDGQYFEMLHRLRKDSLDPAAVAVATSAEEIKEAIQINDLAPAWVERLMAISYSPLTRIDLRRMYDTEVITDDQLVDGLRDIGYTKERATRLKDYYKKVRDDKAKLKGQWLKPAAVIGNFVQGIISEEELRQELNVMFDDSGLIERYIDQARSAHTWRMRKRVIALVQKRFGFGEISIGEAVQILVAAGIPTDVATEWAKKIQIEKPAKPKTATAAQLCKWWTLGLLDADEYLRRLLNIGWPRDDAERIAATCAADSAKKGAKKGSSKNGSKAGSSNGNGG